MKLFFHAEVIHKLVSPEKIVVNYVVQPKMFAYFI